MPAKTWGSYRETLFKILDEFKPKRVFEYGTGKSTDIFCHYPSVERVISVEHDPAYAEPIKARCFDPETHTLIVEEDLKKYADSLQGDPDFIFVDGRERVRCLRNSAHVVGAIVMLHDADRAEYKDGIDLFKLKFYTDDGNTVTLTNDEEKGERIYEALKGSTVKC